MAQLPSNVGAADRIIVSAGEITACPKCGHTFPLREGITQHTLEQYEREYEAVLHDATQSLEAKAQENAEKRLLASHRRQLDDLQGKLREQSERNTVLTAHIAETREKAIKEAAELHAIETENLKKQLAGTIAKVAEFTKRELELRAQKMQLEEAKAELELDVARRLDAERGQIESKVREKESERFQLKEAEYKKKIEDAQRANAVLQRKLEQGSQQLQGEVLELEIETQLRQAFPLDSIDEIKKGARGADVLQSVGTRSGQIAGRIVWESKRAENWSNAWVSKLKEDQQKAGAEIAVLVTTRLPKETSEPFFLYDNIWIARPDVIRPVAEVLRHALLEQHKSRLVSLGRNEKMEALYEYICGPQFAQRIRTVVDSFRSMRSDLEAERAAMERIWRKREKQIERVTQNLVGVSGELQAIAEDSVSALEEVAKLEHIAGASGE